MLLVLEGIDGAGKTTQTKLLHKELKKAGKKVELISFPQYKSDGAKMIENYLAGKLGKLEEVSAEQASVMYAIDRYAGAKRIKELLVKGYIVILDRYISSNLAHQGGKIRNKQKREAFYDWVFDLEYKKLKIAKPDLQIFLDVSPDQAIMFMKNDTKRTKKKDIHERDKSHLQNTYKVYKELFAHNTKSKVAIACDNKTIQDIQVEIHEILKKYLTKKRI